MRLDLDGFSFLVHRFPAGVHRAASGPGCLAVVLGCQAVPRRVL